MDRADSAVTKEAPAGYRNFVVWEKAMDLAESIFGLTNSWPREEQFGLTAQARRSAVSIPSNIAEGRGRSSSKEYSHHLSIANGSLCELETQVLLAARLGFVTQSDRDKVIRSSTQVAKMLNGLIKSLEKSITEADGRDQRLRPNA